MNQDRRPGHDFQVGQLVWVMMPKPLGGRKLQTRWVGPFPIKERRGMSSFAVEFAPESLLDVRVDKLNHGWVVHFRAMESHVLPAYAPPPHTFYP